MKIALCISGQIRCFHEYYENIYKNLIEPNDCDVFFYSDVYNFHELYLTGRGNTTTKFFKEDGTVAMHPNGNPYGRDPFLSEPVPRSEPFVSVERDKEIITEMMKDVVGDRLKKMEITTEDFKYKGEVLCRENFEYHPTLRGEDEYRDPVNFSRPYVQFHKVKMCNDMKNEYEKEQGFRYDYVIRARTDCKYTNPICVKEIVNEMQTKNIWGDKIYLFGDWKPEHDNYPQINIWEGFAFGTPDLMDTYCDFFLDYGKYYTYTKDSVYGTKRGLERSQRLAMHLHHHNIKMIPLKDNGYRQWPTRVYDWHNYGKPIREYM